MSPREPEAGLSLSALRDAPPRDLVIRFVFGLTVSAVAAVIGIVINPRFGGVFLAFPAILPATLTLIEKEKSKQQAKDDDVGAVLGAAALIVFAAIGWGLFTRIGAPLALTTAAAGWLAAAVLMYLVLQAITRRNSR